jgi:hypothetical protein
VVVAAVRVRGLAHLLGAADLPERFGQLLGRNPWTLVGNLDRVDATEVIRAQRDIDERTASVERVPD